MKILWEEDSSKQDKLPLQEIEEKDLLSSNLDPTALQTEMIIRISATNASPFVMLSSGALRKRSPPFDRKGRHYTTNLCKIQIRGYS